MAEKCPICFNDIGTYTDDPMKTPNHFLPALQGYTLQRERHVTEIQNKINEYESQFGISPLTTWTPTDVGQYPYRAQHINEMREAIELILKHEGIPIEDWFSLDANGDPTLGIRDWLGGSRLAKGTIIRGMHIEELRKRISLSLLDIIFGQTGTRYTPNRYMSYAGMGTISPGTTYPYFSKVKPSDSGTYLTVMFNNMTFYCVEQFGALHLFYFNNNESPTYSYNDTGNLDIGNWVPSPYAASPIFIQFNPLLPFSSEDDRYDYEGITGIVIDDSGNDYAMYAIELFYSRIGVSGVPETFNWRDLIGEGVPNYISKYSYPRQRNLGASTGGTNQTLDVSMQGIIVPMLNNSERIYVNGHLWFKVSNFSSSSPTDLHYTINYTTGIITFGDGVNGKIPVERQTISIFITLMGGGIWKYEGIEIQRDVKSYIHALQIANGKLFYMKKDNAFESGFVILKNITTNFVKRHLFNSWDGDPSHGYGGWASPNEDTEVYNTFDGNVYYKYQYGHNINVTGFGYGNTLSSTVTGGFTFVPGFNWSGVESSFLYLPVTPITGYQRPNVLDSTVENFSIHFDTYTGVPNSLQSLRYVSANFISKSKQAKVFQSAPYMYYVSKQEYFGHWDFADPYNPVWHPEYGNSQRIVVMGHTSVSPFRCVRMFDLRAPSGKSLYDIMTWNPSISAYGYGDFVSGPYYFIQSSSYGATFGSNNTGTSGPFEIEYEIDEYDLAAPLFGEPVVRATHTFIVGCNV